MSGNQQFVIALLTAVVAMVTGFVPLYIQLRGLKKDMNGLLAARVEAAAREGEHRGEVLARDKADSRVRAVTQETADAAALVVTDAAAAAAVVLADAAKVTKEGT